MPRTLPGPRAPSVVNMLRFGRDPHGYLPRLHRRYGDVFSVKYPTFGRVVYVADPELVKELFTGKPTELHAGEANATVLEPAVGLNSVLTLDEDEHMRQRKLLLAPFHGDGLRFFRDVMLDATRRDLASWPVGEPFAVRDRMQRITLDVILRAVYGLDEEADGRAHAIVDEFTLASQALLLPEPVRFERFGGWRRFTRAREALDALLAETIAARRAAGDCEERDDVLSLLMRAGSTDRELRDELVTVLGAGHETTATALSWAIERLVRHPDVLARLRDSLPEGDEYLDAVIRETLRVRPVLVDVARKLTVPRTVGGHEIPAGTLVMVAISAVHAREDLYPDAAAFRPERFLEHPPETYSWVPFGGGVRRCLGAAFAQEEMRVVLREVISRATLRATDAADEQGVMRNITTAPKHGGRVVLDELRPVEDDRGADRPAAVDDDAVALARPVAQAAAADQ